MPSKTNQDSPELLAAGETLLEAIDGFYRSAHRFYSGFLQDDERRHLEDLFIPFLSAETLDFQLLKEFLLALDKNEILLALSKYEIPASASAASVSVENYSKGEKIFIEFARIWRHVHTLAVNYQQLLDRQEQAANCTEKVNADFASKALTGLETIIQKIRQDRPLHVASVSQQTVVTSSVSSSVTFAQRDASASAQDQTPHSTQTARQVYLQRVKACYTKEIEDYYNDKLHRWWYKKDKPKEIAKEEVMAVALGLMRGTKTVADLKKIVLEKPQYNEVSFGFSKAERLVETALRLNGCKQHEIELLRLQVDLHNYLRKKITENGVDHNYLLSKVGTIQDGEINLREPRDKQQRIVAALVTATFSSGEKENKKCFEKEVDAFKVAGTMLALKVARDLAAGNLPDIGTVEKLKRLINDERFGDTYIGRSKAVDLAKEAIGKYDAKVRAISAEVRKQQQQQQQQQQIQKQKHDQAIAEGLKQAQLQQAQREAKQQTTTNQVETGHASAANPSANAEVQANRARIKADL